MRRFSLAYERGFEIGKQACEYWQAGDEIPDCRDWNESELVQVTWPAITTDEMHQFAHGFDDAAAQATGTDLSSRKPTAAEYFGGCDPMGLGGEA